MKLTWLGTASVLLELGKTKLLFDPYLRKRGKDLPPFPLDALRGVTAIFITHPHFDHFADTKEIMAACEAPVYVNRRGTELAEAQGFASSQLRCLSPDDTLTFGAFTVTARLSRHVEFDRKLIASVYARALLPWNTRAGLHFQKLNNLYEIDKETDVLAYEITVQGKRILLLGTAGYREELSCPSGVDLMIYPYQGRSDLSTYSLQFLERYRPRKVFLDHFDNAFPPVSQRIDCREFVQLAGELYPQTEITVPEALVPYEIFG
ncbi:MAG: MBL fold metallo-hydrolase [Ruminococcaceae bacterium]|nr:MBL fold metallo-hydrolase [Oscillospiraceae bacterium]